MTPRWLPPAAAVALLCLLGGLAAAGPANGPPSSTPSVPPATPPLIRTSLELSLRGSHGDLLTIDGEVMDWHSALCATIAFHIEWLLLAAHVETQVPSTVFIDHTSQAHVAALIGIERPAPIGPFEMQLLGEAGIHHFGGLGEALFQSRISGPGSVDLPYVGGRLGLTHVPRGQSVVYLGLWLFARTDLEERRARLGIRYGGFFGSSYGEEVYHLGGTELGAAARMGVIF
jgi:hypothetical protein